MSTPALSVLDLVPVRQDQTTGDALAATRSLARVADRHGYRRYWLAEHHNMPAVAATNPPVLIAMVAAATERIRVGSGGVMLPNHAPLVVAEQFALLEAAHPGRIDLGIGRAPGTDPVTSYALRHGAGGVEADAVAAVPAVRRRRHRADVARRRGHPGGRRRAPAARDAARRVGARGVAARARPTTRPAWRPSAACPTSSRTTSPAVEPRRPWSSTAPATRRPRRTPSRAPSSPSTSWWRRPRPRPSGWSLPNLASMVALRTAGPLAPQLLVEQAEEAGIADAHRAPRRRDARAAGSSERPTSVAEQVAALAAEHAVDEVMVHPVAGAVVGTPADRAPAREATLALLAEAFGQQAA